MNFKPSQINFKNSNNNINNNNYFLLNEGNLNLNTLDFKNQIKNNTNNNTNNNNNNINNNNISNRRGSQCPSNFNNNSRRASLLANNVDFKNYVPYIFQHYNNMKIPALSKGLTLNEDSQDLDSENSFDSHNNNNSNLNNKKNNEENININIDKDNNNDNNNDNDESSFFALNRISVPKENFDLINSELEKIDSSNFNVFTLSELTNGLELFYFMKFLFTRRNYGEKLNINKKIFKNYFLKVNESYQKIPYHNSIHACDVTQTLNVFIMETQLEQNCELTNLETFSVYFATGIHDLDHSGNSNIWETNTFSNLALSYNDRSVLENYHLCRAFSLLKVKDLNIFDNFSLKDYKESRGIIISLVLATDMSNHFPDLAVLNDKIKNGNFNAKNKEKQILLNGLVHASDISNPLKDMNLYEKWTKRIFAEFFKQGDREKELGIKVSYLCDRNTVDIIDAQIGFIDGIVMPLFKTLMNPLPNMEIFVKILEINKGLLKEMKEKGEKIEI